MTRAVCHLERADRGCRIISARFVTSEIDERWTSSRLADATAEASLLDAAEAARWVRDRVASLPGRRLDAVCVDADGSVCTWLTAPSSEHSVVVAAFSQGQDTLVGGGAEVNGQAGALSLEATAVQAIADVPGGGASRWSRRGATVTTGRRLAVLALPDAAVRVFLDELDAHGMSPQRVESLWHAMARAWDAVATGEAPGPKADRVVAENQRTTAVVLIDPRGMLCWCWSRGGRLLTGGTIRIGHVEGDEGGVCVESSDVGRLTTDWLAWSAQLGAAPDRVVCVTPGLNGSSGLDDGGLGRALSSVWPGAGVDMVVHDDPVGATLRRLARMDGSSIPETGATTLLPLTRRPARAHRAMHVWAAVAIVAVSCVLAALGIRADRAAGELAAAAVTLGQETRKEVEPIDAQIAASPLMVRELRSLVEQMEQRVARPDSGAVSRPIMQELLTVAMILSGFTEAGVEVEMMDINLVAGRVDVLVPQTAEGTFAAEQLERSLQAVRSSLAWQGRFGTATVGGAMGPRNRYTLTGVWREVSPSAGEGGR